MASKLLSAVRQMGGGPQLAYLGNPALRAPARAVENPTSRKTTRLVEAMFKTMEEEAGCGLAAPQLQQPLRMFVMHAATGWDKPLTPADKKSMMWSKIAVINPVIHARSKETEIDWEGCLSVPGYTALVRRPVEISVEFTMSSGEVVRTDVKGFPARVFQHEFDHLEGVMYLDRVENNKDIVMTSEHHWVAN